MSWIVPEGHRAYGHSVRVETFTSNGFRGRGPRRTVSSSTWFCETCGSRGPSASGYFNPYPSLINHEATGHTPCEFCGKSLPNRMDGSPRQHDYRKCPGKNASHKIVSGYAKDITKQVVA